MFNFSLGCFQCCLKISYITVYILVRLRTKLILEYLYITFVYTYYEYTGFIYDFLIYKYIFGWVIYIAGYCMIYLKKNIYLVELFLFVFLLYILPNTIYYSLTNQNTSHYLALVLPFFIILSLISTKTFDLPILPMSKPIILFIAFILL